VNTAKPTNLRHKGLASIAEGTPGNTAKPKHLRPMGWPRGLVIEADEKKCKADPPKNIKKYHFVSFCHLWCPVPCHVSADEKKYPIPRPANKISKSIILYRFRTFLHIFARAAA
jgi:hypothetical protein